MSSWPSSSLDRHPLSTFYSPTVVRLSFSSPFPFFPVSLLSFFAFPQFPSFVVVLTCSPTLRRSWTTTTSLSVWTRGLLQSECSPKSGSLSHAPSFFLYHAPFVPFLSPSTCLPRSLSKLMSARLARAYLIPIRERLPASKLPGDRLALGNQCVDRRSPSV